jgi:catechol 2,3-dioxygenase-like lactoylglutathione lyase family enzyme
VVGAGLNVMDLEGQRAWYAAKLGMTLLATNKAADGSPYEYMMGSGAAIISLLKWPADQPRPNAIGRIMLGVPDARGLADWLKTQGVDNRQMVANSSYYVTDPEGNGIALYTPGPEAVGAAPAAVPKPSAPCGSGPTRSRLLEAAEQMIRGGNAYMFERAQDMYRQGLAQQSIFDEQYANCLRSNAPPSR